MKKIPTVFERDWNGDRSRIVNQVHKDCGWVLAGEGSATRKLDGTCCMVRGHTLYKRRELRKGEPEPYGFERADFDEETGKTVGWVLVSVDDPADRWHREAYAELGHVFPDGTYELIGPKVQGNPEHCLGHQLVRHGDIMEDDVPRTFEGLRDWLSTQDIEGIVFHHPDGRMAKIKLRDFGLKRKASSPQVTTPLQTSKGE
jgi:hypothetical protein